MTVVPQGGPATWSIELKGEGALVTGRHGPRRAHPNAVHTARYTLLTWLPKSVLHQFRKRANVFFLFVAVSLLSCRCPPRGTAMGVTFSVMLLIQMLMDLAEDLRRRRDDYLENARRFHRYSPSGVVMFEDVKWEDCRVGDVILVLKDEPLPADMLAVATGDEGTCFVSTASLDGENNLKHKLAVEMLRSNREALWQQPEEAAAACLAAQPQLALGLPCRGLSALQGRLTADGQDWGLQPEHFLLRGSTLRNTPWVLGIVCYVGEDTKVRLDATPSTAKFSDIHHTLNRFVACFIVCLTVLCIYLTAGAMLVGNLPRLQGPAFLCNTDNLFITFWRSILVFYTIFPVTLYLFTQITKELCRSFVNRDGLLRDPVDGAMAMMRTSDLVEELGQVHAIFSDKTGTLTANDMQFAFCCVGNAVLGPFRPHQAIGAPVQGAEEAQEMLQGKRGAAVQVRARQFFLALAVCHEVQLDEGGAYQGESPDEVALVRAAASLGTVLRKRASRGTGSVLTVETQWGTEELEVSHVLKFSSERKRMSALLRRQGGGATVLTKGADTTVEPLLREGQLPWDAAAANRRFARSGYRTLVLARREMEPAEFAEWSQRWQAAYASTSERTERLAAVASSAERDLEYVGITVLEDRLQEGVPEAIAAIRQASIGIWVLTGDAVDTALAVAKACRLFDEGTQISCVTGVVSPEQAAAKLQAAVSGLELGTPHGLVLDGASVQQALQSTDARQALHQLGSAGTCVACRLTPAQKRELVELAHSVNPKTITLAVGDGANDVPMLQAAHIGVSIMGKEGTAAKQASDVAISQFRFLRRVLFHHGRQAYEKVSLFILWYMYKQLLVSWSNIIFATSVQFRVRNCWAGNVEDVMGLLEFLSYPIIFSGTGLLTDSTMGRPELYHPGPQRLIFNGRKAAGWLLLGTWHGVLAWCMPVFLLTDNADRQADPPSRRFWEGSITAYTVVTATVYLKLGLEARRNMNLRGLAALASLVPAYILFLLLLTLDAPFNPFFTPELTGGVAWVMFTSWQHGLCVLLVPCLALLPDMALALCCRDPAQGSLAMVHGIVKTSSGWSTLGGGA